MLAALDERLLASPPGAGRRGATRLGRRRAPGASRGRSSRRGPRLRHLPYRSPRRRGRARAASVAGDSRAPDRRHRRRARTACTALRAGRARGHRLASSHVWSLRVLRAGHENLCDRPEFTGWTVDGGYAEYVVAPEAFVYPIPAGFADLRGGPAALRGHHRLSLAATLGNRHGVAARPHRLRRGRARGDSGRAPLGRRGLRDHPRAPSPRPGPCELGAVWAGGAAKSPPSVSTPPSCSPLPVSSSHRRSRCSARGACSCSAAST